MPSVREACASLPSRTSATELHRRPDVSACLLDHTAHRALCRHAPPLEPPDDEGDAILPAPVGGGPADVNGGLGVMLLAVLGLIGSTNRHGTNGLKNLLSAILSVVSITTYATADLIAW